MSRLMKPGSKSFYRLTKPVVFLFCLLPLAYLLARAFTVAGLGLGANPIEELLHELGRWGLKFLLLTLTVTPLRRWTGWNWLIGYRRMLGLFAFFYVVLHFTVYAVLDQSLDIRGYHRGYCQATLYHTGYGRIVNAGSTGGHIDKGYDAATG